MSPQISEVEAGILSQLSDAKRGHLKALLGAERIGYRLSTKWRTERIGHGAPELTFAAHLDILGGIEEIIGPDEFARLFNGRKEE